MVTIFRGTDSDIWRAQLGAFLVESILCGTADHVLTRTKYILEPPKTGDRFYAEEPHLYCNGPAEQIAYFPACRLGRRRVPDGYNDHRYLRDETPVRFHPYREHMTRRSAERMPEWASRLECEIVQTKKVLLHNLRPVQIQRAGINLSALKVAEKRGLYTLALRRIWDRYSPEGWPDYEENPIVTLFQVRTTERSCRESVSASALLRRRLLRVSMETSYD